MYRIADLLIQSTLETLYMVSLSTLFALSLGFPLGILLVITKKDNILPKEKFNKVLNTIINISRSIPFIILMIILFPLSRIIVGTTIGTTASIVPLSIAASPFVARMIESALLEVDPGVIEAVKAMGSTPWQMITKVLIPETLPSIVLGITITVINIISYSAMAGAIGGGGLGNLAIRYGFHRFETTILIAAVIVLVVLVQIVQSIGNKLSNILLERIS